MKVLITGATGNVGMEVLKALQGLDHALEVVAGVRDREADSRRLARYGVSCVDFDFLDTGTYGPALRGCDILFLLRPPQLSDVATYFVPLVSACKAAAVSHVVFLSVQGVEKSSIIPHHKIEKLIVDSALNYTFLRPAYFMQNFTTTLRNDMVTKRRIYLPAGKAAFTLIDVRDVGAVVAAVLCNSAQHVNKAYDLTCRQRLTFAEMAAALSTGLGTRIQYRSPDLLSFFLTKRKEGTPAMLILVMIMLHYLPRFQPAPTISDAVERILHRPPISFGAFIEEHKELLMG